MWSRGGGLQIRVIIVSDPFHAVIWCIVIKNTDYSLFNNTESETVTAGSPFTLLHTANVHYRFSCQLELHHYQTLTSQFSSTNLFPTWVNGSSSSVLDAFMRLDQYKRQLLSGGLCINMDLQGSFGTKPMSPDEGPPSILSPEGLTMQTGCLPPAPDCGEISSSSIRSFWQVYAADPGTV